MTRAAALLVLLAAGVAHADDEDEFAGGAVVFARDQALWKTDPRGKGPAVELLALPGAAADVRAIRTDPSGRVILFDLAGTWWWSRLDAARAAGSAPAQLPCADAPARLTVDGRVVECATADGKLLLISLVTGKVRKQPVPAGARFVVSGARDVVWADGEGVWRAPVADLTQKREVAPDAPLRGFSAAPDGSRAVGIYQGHVYERVDGKRQQVPAEVLDSFALDGKAARRKLHRDARVIDWSADSQWLLVQDGAQACITRATGGQYKCWKKSTAISLAPDGRFALVLRDRPGESRRRDGDDDDDDDRREGGEGGGDGGEGGDDDGEADEAEARKGAASAVRTPPFSVYRVLLEGAHAARPSLVETVVDGAALWLPGDPP